MQERIQILLRKRQIVFEGNNVVVQCNVDGTAEYVPGDIPDNNWLDFTAFTDGLDKLSLEWSETSSGNADGGETNEAGSNYDKGISLTLTFHDAAYQFIYDHLLQNPCGIINAVEVRLIDLFCDKEYRPFEIKADNLTYRPFDAPCEFEVRLREQDLIWHCVHKNFIFDNWQNWFIDGGAKQHPTFLTCVEPRPRLITSAKLTLWMAGLTIPVIPTFLNLDGDDGARKILGLNNFVPAPLVRDYISNICDKCGIAIDTMFDDLPGNPYRNLCVFYPLAGHKFWHHNNDDTITSPAAWYFFENRWLITLADFLDKMKHVFKAEWYVTPNNKLIFKPKSYFTLMAAMYDYSAAGARPFYELEYSFDGTKKPAYGRYQYQADPSDMASQEISSLYNDLVDYDGPANNPMLEGEYSNNFDFSPTGFVRDGRADDYIREIINDAETGSYVLVAVLTIVAIAFLPGVFTTVGAIILGASILAWVLGISHKGNHWRDGFAEWETGYTGAVRITADQVANPRLLLWDGENMLSAKVVRQDAPAPNLYYNPTAIPYTTRNTINDHGVVFNYPMYFDGFYKDNLFDHYHSPNDNPLLSLETHQTFTLKEDLCCEAITLYGLWDGDFARIGYVIKIEDRNGHGIFGKVGNISVDYDDEKIVIKGKVIKRIN